MRFQKILLIDDDIEDIELFMLALHAIDPTVSCESFTSAAEALHLLDQKKLYPDAIFIDLNMPMMSGEQFMAAKVKRDDLSNIPAFVLTTTSEERVFENVRQMGATDAFTKPASFAALKLLVASVIK